LPGGGALVVYRCLDVKQLSSLDGHEIALALTTIMIGSSLALKATAAWLLVAIPCVVINKVLRRRVSELLAQYKAQCGS
jgi:biopolymer transport protein ExbB/TolQ